MLLYLLVTVQASLHTDVLLLQQDLQEAFQCLLDLLEPTT